MANLALASMLDAEDLRTEDLRMERIERGREEQVELRKQEIKVGWCEGGRAKDKGPDFRPFSSHPMRYTAPMIDLGLCISMSFPFPVSMLSLDAALALALSGSCCSPATRCRKLIGPMRIPFER